MLNSTVGPESSTTPNQAAASQKVAMSSVTVNAADPIDG
jgi:hypothetical protein